MLGMAGIETGCNKTQGRNRAAPGGTAQMPREQKHPKTAEGPYGHPVCNVTLLWIDRKKASGEKNGRRRSQLGFRPVWPSSTDPGIPFQEMPRSGLVPYQRELWSKKVNRIPLWRGASRQETNIAQCQNNEKQQRSEDPTGRRRFER